EEDEGVQLALVNSAVKFFLKRPQQGQALVLKALQTATEKCANPDVRDRAYIYWRLLSADPNAARAVALVEMPPVELESASLSTALLEELIAELGSVASVLQKPARLFVYKKADKAGVPRDSELASAGFDSVESGAASAGDSGATGGIDTSNEGEPELLISF
ncbi:beta-adaptin, partial [Coemansia sp. RSA 25]